MNLFLKIIKKIICPTLEVTALIIYCNLQGGELIKAVQPVVPF